MTVSSGPIRTSRVGPLFRAESWRREKREESEEWGVGSGELKIESSTNDPPLKLMTNDH